MPVRPLYNAVVMLSGSRDNSVMVYDATAPELALLRVLHGGDNGVEPLLDVTPTKKGVDRSDEQERARIGLRYSQPGKQNGLTILNSLFGVGNRLPLEYAPPEQVETTEAPLLGTEKIVDLEEPTGPITSTPDQLEKPKRKIGRPFAKKVSVLED